MVRELSGQPEERQKPHETPANPVVFWPPMLRLSPESTLGQGFLQNDAAWRTLPLLPGGERRSPFFFRLVVDDKPGVLARVADALAQREISIARLRQHQNGTGAVLHVVTHEASTGALERALEAIEALPEVRARPTALPVISDRGVAELGWA